MKKTDWEKKAELALKKDDEALAGKALERSGQHEENGKTLNVSWKKQNIAVKDLKDTIIGMENQLAEFKRSKDTLIAQSKTADRGNVAAGNGRAAKLKYGRDNNRGLDGNGAGPGETKVNRIIKPGGRIPRVVEAGGSDGLPARAIGENGDVAGAAVGLRGSDKGQRCDQYDD